MSEIYGGTVVATVWVTPSLELGTEPSYSVSPVVLPQGPSVLIFNLVTLNLVGDVAPVPFKSGIGIQLDETRMAEKGITVTNLELVRFTSTQWGFAVDNQADEPCVLNFLVNAAGEPGKHDPTVIFTTDPVIPPP